MATPSYTKTTHSKTYPSISPTRPALTTNTKTILITGSTGGIGRATAQSYASSHPRAIILLGRRADSLAETASLVQAIDGSISVQTHAVDLCNAPAVRSVMDQVAAEFGGIDILVH